MGEEEKCDVCICGLFHSFEARGVIDFEKISFIFVSDKNVDTTNGHINFS